MALRLLVLKLAILGNVARGSLSRGLRSFGVVLVVTGAGIGGVYWVVSQSDPQSVAAALAVFGAALGTALFVLPALAARPDPMPPRALLGISAPPGRIARGLVLAAVVGRAAPPLLVATGASLAVPVNVSPPARPLLAVVAALTAATLLRLGVSAGDALAVRPQARRVSRAFSVLGILAVAVLLLARALRGQADALLIESASLASRTPWGAVWALPMRWAEGAGRVETLVALGTLVTLWLIWLGTVRRALRGLGRRHPPARSGVSSGYRVFSRSRTGAVLARTVVYWRRDPRYLVGLLAIPAIPLLVLGAFWIGGIPAGVAAVAVLPVMVLIVAASIAHNDIAYDHSAIWVQLVAPVRGLQDRVARALPALVLGGGVIAVSMPGVVWLWGGTEPVEPLLGCCLAILLGGVGVSSYVSVRFPYAAPRPGDSAFQQPQVPGENAIRVQTLTVLLIAVVSAPSFVLAWWWLLEGEPWGWWTLVVGASSGTLALLVGLLAGAWVYTRRGPEILASALRN